LFQFVQNRKLLYVQKFKRILPCFDVKIQACYFSYQERKKAKQPQIVVDVADEDFTEKHQMKRGNPGALSSETASVNRSNRSGRSGPEKKRHDRAAVSGDDADRGDHMALQPDHLLAALHRSNKSLHSSINKLTERMSAMEESLERITALLLKRHKTVRITNENNCSNHELEYRSRASRRNTDIEVKSKLPKKKQLHNKQTRPELPQSTLIYENESTENLDAAPNCSRTARDVVIYDLEDEDV